MLVAASPSTHLAPTMVRRQLIPHQLCNCPNFQKALAVLWIVVAELQACCLGTSRYLCAHSVHAGLAASYWLSFPASGVAAKANGASYTSDVFAVLATSAQSCCPPPLPNKAAKYWLRHLTTTPVRDMLTVEDLRSTAAAIIPHKYPSQVLGTITGLRHQ